MGVAGRIAEIIFAVKFVHPRCFEETAIMVAAQEGLALFIDDLQRAGRFGEFQLPR